MPAHPPPRRPGLDPGPRATPTNAPRPRRAGRAIPVLLTALLTLAATPSPAATEQLRYTPATCSTDAEGKVYVRLNTSVAFGFPADALKGLRGEIQFDPPAVPKPDDPEGCPGNPILTPAAYLQFHLPAPAASATEEFTPDIPLGFAIIGANAAAHNPDGYLRLQGSALHRFRTKREDGMWCESTPAGWDVCYGTNKRHARPAKRGGATYVAREDMHPLRSGAPITMDCWPPDPSGGRRCSPHYKPLPRVSLSLHFYDVVIPVEQFFDLDREITQRLKAARVPALDFAPPAHVLHRPEKDR